MITKEYIIQSVVPINKNVIDDKLLPYIGKAIRKLQSVFDADLFSDLEDLADLELIDWSKNNAYVADDQVLFSEYGVVKVWKSLTTNTNEKPSTTNTTNWEEVELGTLLEGYVRPYLSHDVYCAYAVNSGINVSHQGLQEIQNESAQQVSGVKLDAYLSYWQNEKAALKRSLYKYFSDMAYTFDSTTYDSVDVDKRRTGFKIRATGVNRQLPNQDMIS